MQMENLFVIYHSGIGRFHADPGKVSDFPGQSGNDVLRRIQSYADDVDFQLAVGNSQIGRASCRERV